jgi:GNAT superfamily N-acetyltransferase
MDQARAVDITRPITIRTIEAGDAEEVSLLIGQLGYERSREAVRGWIEELGSRAHNQAAFVACLGAEVVGWIEVSLERRLQAPAFALIGGLVVREGTRGLGIGRRLCRQAELWSRDCGVATLRVTSRSTRPEAHRFYLGDGYRQVKTSLVFEKKL